MCGVIIRVGVSTGVYQFNLMCVYVSALLAYISLRVCGMFTCVCVCVCVFIINISLSIYICLPLYL